VLHKVARKGESHFSIVGVGARRFSGIPEHFRLVGKPAAQPICFLPFKSGTDTIGDRFAKQATVDLFNPHGSDFRFKQSAETTT
jgi:hypothetical protein